MHTIPVKMKRGGTMMLEADGRCYRDSYGSGEPITAVEDLVLYWPQKKRDKKLYPVKDTLVADWDQVEQAFWDACMS